MVPRLEAQEVFPAPRRRIAPLHQLDVILAHTLALNFAAPDAPAALPRLVHLTQHVLAHVRLRDGAPVDVLVGDVPDHTVESDPRVHPNLGPAQHLNELVVAVWHVSALVEPLFDDRPRCDLARVYLPLVCLEVGVEQHVPKHVQVLLRGRPGEVWHQVQVDLEAVVLSSRSARTASSRKAWRLTSSRMSRCVCWMPSCTRVQPNSRKRRISPSLMQSGRVSRVTPIILQEARSFRRCSVSRSSRGRLSSGRSQNVLADQKRSRMKVR